jgi:hypothetical protein
MSLYRNLPNRVALTFALRTPHLAPQGARPSDAGEAGGGRLQEYRNLI